MRIRVEILETEPYQTNGTYVWDSGKTEDQNAGKLTADMVAFVLRSLNELHVLKVIR